MRQYEPPHPLTAPERAEVLAVANSPEFGHLPPSQIVPRLADPGRYLAPESTFYRVLRAAGQRAHRRSERPSQTRSKPQAVCATAPNQVYSWDITDLPATIRGQFFYLYLFLDLFSRKIVGWQVYEKESSVLAAGIVRDICQHEGIQRHQLLLHSDNGGPMKGTTMLATLHGLGVRPSFSRPAVSNDNPYSESLFKTLKYRPDYPLRPFADLAAARQWVTDLVAWYNHEHRHSAIRFVTPAQRPCRTRRTAPGTPQERLRSRSSTQSSALVRPDPQLATNSGGSPQPESNQRPRYRSQGGKKPDPKGRVTFNHRGDN